MKILNDADNRAGLFRRIPGRDDSTENRVEVELLDRCLIYQINMIRVACNLA